MKEFELWFVYYDSLFLSGNPKLIPCMLQQYSHLVPQETWEKNSCPDLTRAFEFLQAFIKEPDNWTHSQCSPQQMKTVESGVNHLLNFLQIEKSYSNLFWRIDSRRVEASFVHFYSFLQMLVKAVIPNPKMTLFECRKAKKLCLKLSKLQNMINKVLRCLKPILDYLSVPKFSEEKPLIENFFENLIIFMKKLPQIRCYKMNHVHTLSKFIHLTNPIEICSGSRNKNIYENCCRKKSNSECIMPKVKSDQEVGLNQSDNIRGSKKDQNSGNSRSLSLCSKLFSCSKSIKIITFQPQFHLPQEKKRKQISTSSSIPFAPIQNHYLNFPTKVSECETQLKITDMTSNTLKSIENSELMLKEKKTKSFVLNRELYSELFLQPIESSLPFSLKNKQFFSEAEREHEVSDCSETCETRRQKLSFREAKSLREQREQNNCFFHEPSKLLQIRTGKVQSKRWNLLKSYIHQRIKLRKINKLLDW